MSLNTSLVGFVLNKENAHRINYGHSHAWRVLWYERKFSNEVYYHQPRIRKSQQNMISEVQRTYCSVLNARCLFKIRRSVGALGCTRANKRPSLLLT
jgi:hypothetical protein